jgi:PAS domain S-box-containing protein
MKNPALILYLEDNPRDAELVRDKLLQQLDVVHELHVVHDRAEYEAAVARTRFDLILSDYSLPDYDGMAAMELACTQQPDVPFIMISGTLGEEMAVECLLRGATDYLLKDRLERLAPALMRALAEAGEKQRRREMEQALIESEDKYRSIVENSIVGISQALPDGRLINANQSYAEMYGYATAAEMISDAPDVAQRYANPDDRQEVLRILQEKGIMAPREIHRSPSRRVSHRCAGRGARNTGLRGESALLPGGTSGHHRTQAGGKGTEGFESSVRGGSGKCPVHAFSQRSDRPAFRHLQSRGRGTSGL